MALIAAISTWGIAEWAIAIVVILGIIALVYIGAEKLGIPVPPFIIKVAGVVFAVVIIVIAIRFLSQL